MHIERRKIFRYISNLLLRSHISELLEIFHVSRKHSKLKNKITRCLVHKIATSFNEVIFV